MRSWQALAVGFHDDQFAVLLAFVQTTRKELSKLIALERLINAPIGEIGGLVLSTGTWQLLNTPARAENVNAVFRRLRYLIEVLREFDIYSARELDQMEDSLLAEDILQDDFLAAHGLGGPRTHYYLSLTDLLELDIDWDPDPLRDIQDKRALLNFIVHSFRSSSDSSASKPTGIS